MRPRILLSRGACTAVLGVGMLLGSAAAPTAASMSEAAATRASTASSFERQIEEPPGFGSAAELMAVQRKLNAAADRLQTALGGRVGFAGITVPVEQRRVTLHWKGAVPVSIERVVDQVRGGIPVTIQQARYSQRELAAAQTRLLARATRAKVSIHNISPLPGGAGLAVAASGSAAATALSTEPVQVIRESVRPVSGSRTDDSAPYSGGAYWHTDTSACSTGYGVRRNVDGRTFLLSAGHCAANGQNAYTGRDRLMGPVTGNNPSRDWLLIEAPSGSSVYSGTVDASGEPVEDVKVPVIGDSANYVGNYVCTSGAASGLRCNIRIVRVGEAVVFQGGGIVYGLMRAEQQDRVSGGGNGDSGGPVGAPSADLISSYAHGIFTGMDGNTAVPCTGVPSGSGRFCAWRIWFSGVRPALQAYGASINVG